jgi:hypothetical protein
MVNDWINDHFGTIDEILMSSIISQIDVNNFFYMKSEDQKTILDKSLNLESIGYFGKYLHECILAHNDIIQSLTTVITTIYGIIKDKPKTPTVSKDKIQNLEEEIQHKSKLLEINRNELESLITIFGSNFTPKSQSLTTDDIADLEKQIKSYNKSYNDIDLSETDKNDYLSIIAIKKSLLKSIKNDLQNISDINNDIDITIKEDIEEKLNNIKIEVSKDLIIKKEKEYNSWAKKQNSDWLNDIDNLINYKEECIANLLELKTKYNKSSLDTNKKYINLNDKYNHLLHNPINLLMSEKEMEEWTVKYDKWISMVSEVNSDNFNSSEQLKDQYDKYCEFIKKFDCKKDKKYVLDAF